MEKTSKTTSNKFAPSRSRFEGMKRVLTFNAGAYSAAAGTIACAIGLSKQKGVPRVWRSIASLAAALTTYQTLASLIASHWVYDLSPLHYWRWLAEIVPDPKTILNVVAGYDETTISLQRTYPAAKVNVVDFYGDLGKRESSIRRAQKLFPTQGNPVSRNLTGWTLEDHSIDLVLLAFAAHEVRDRERRAQLFEEASRVLRADGAIVLVEHLRDKQNFLAYGPGFMHFLPETEWLKCASAANLKVRKKFNITPFVAVFVLCL
ncbi:MAG: methyltransferase domain-containing protein [Candidatus Obscuribacterales bacterium]|nr:methyltransferase domain-containing protein [Candidatus Obscuribacterales bacterium]